MNVKKFRSFVAAAIAVGAACALTAVTPSQSSAEAGKQAPKQETIEVLQETGEVFAQIAEQAKPSVVFIEVSKTAEGPQMMQLDIPEQFRRFFDQRSMPGTPQAPAPRRFKQQGQGSGFIISKDGYILSNHHVVGDADEITVTLHDGTEYKAEVIGTDKKSDVALIKIDAKYLQPLELGDSDSLRVGQWVLAIGNPFGLTQTVTAGIVSAMGRNNVGITDYENFIQTDAAINPGNSGGPMLDIHGRVVGINTAIYSRSGGYMGVGFAIPVNMAASIKDQLVEHGKVTRGFLGILIQEVTPELAEEFDIDHHHGIIVSEVLEDSAAEAAGLEPGDVITRLNGKDVKDVGSFRNSVASYAPGSRLKLGIVREGKEKEITARIKALPEDDAVAANSIDEDEDVLGIAVEPLNKELMARYGYDKDDAQRGSVVITSVSSDSPSYEAGLRPGMIINRIEQHKISNMDDYLSAVKEAAKDKKVLMRVSTPQGSRFLVIKMS